MKFKVGGKVRTLDSKDIDDRNMELFPVGTVGVIAKIYDNGMYKVVSNGGYLFYAESQLELVDDNAEKKEAAIEPIMRGIKQDVDAAYDRGYKVGQKFEKRISGDDAKAEYERGKKEGREEAWNAARKIVLQGCDGGLYIKELCDIFSDGSAEKILRRMTADEAIEKIAAYEQKKKDAEIEIKVGDEVASGKSRFLVSRVSRDFCYGIDALGETIQSMINSCRKTGRTFPQIVEMLEAMRTEGEDE